MSAGCADEVAEDKDEGEGEQTAAVEDEDAADRFQLLLSLLLLLLESPAFEEAVGRSRHSHSPHDRTDCQCVCELVETESICIEWLPRWESSAVQRRGHISMNLPSLTGFLVCH